MPDLPPHSPPSGPPIDDPPRAAETPEADARFYLLGLVDFEASLTLQRRVLYDVSTRDDGQATVLLCEHPPAISVGRLGSRADVRLGARELVKRRLTAHWLGRGGGTILHVPGQLAIYPLVSLAWRRWTVGQYVDRLERAVVRAMAAVGVVGQTRPDRHGVWGRSGQLAYFGLSVRDWTTCHGAFVNVAPPLGPFRAIECDRSGQTGASSLEAERQRPVKMAAFRAAIIESLAIELAVRRYDLFTGHPQLVPGRRDFSQGSRRVV